MLYFHLNNQFYIFVDFMSKTPLYYVFIAIQQTELILILTKCLLN